ncbi:MAG: 6-carboxytetrahydropterin synthase [Bacteroidia bacterium]|jgi:6-pyruvoyltetrahydropterin/6-carboxytetrahydropterin synthase|tara:strand:+ start:315 stop:722 length:408 start_codon:yes stop_codon:yes gene_type:complete
MVYVTRKVHFNGAHKLYNPKWSEEKNEEVFGRCANKNWHGHNFDMYVTVKGNPNPDTGFVMDLKKLKIILNDKVVSKLDHSNFNVDVDFLKDVMPSIENIVMKIWEQILPELPADVQLHCIKLYETENQYVEYYG